MVEGPPASNDDNAYKNNDTKQSTRNTHAHTNTKQQREDEKKTKWRLWKIALQPFSASFSSFFFHFRSELDKRRTEWVPPPSSPSLHPLDCVFIFHSFERSVGFLVWVLNGMHSTVSHIHTHRGTRIGDDRRECIRERNHHQMNDLNNNNKINKIKGKK